MNYVISDIHGCGIELYRLIEQIQRNDQDANLFAVGDLFDRAPYGHLVWQAIREYNIQAVRGNHEQKLLKFLKGERDTVPNHYLHAMSLLAGVCQADELEDYLEALPLQISLPGHIITHAGVNLENEYEPNISSNVYGTWKPKPWWTYYKGQSKVVYGHLPSGGKSPRVYGNTIGIDTAACRGGYLTAYCLETGRIEQVQSPKDYFAELKQEMKNAKKLNR